MESLLGSDPIAFEVSLENETYTKLGATLVISFLLIFLAYFMIKQIFNK